MRKKPDPINVHVGKSIRVLRLAKGLPQSAVGKALGVTFQQVYKYELGINRVGPSQLTKLSKLFGVPVTRFFDDQDHGGDAGTSEVVINLLSQPFAIRMLRAFAGVRDSRIRLSIIRLIETIAKRKD